MLRKVIFIAAIILLSYSGALAFHLPFLHRQSLFNVGFGKLEIGYPKRMVGDNRDQYVEYPTAAQILLCEAALRCEERVVRRQLWRTMLFDRPGSDSLVTEALRANIGYFHLINDPLWLNYMWLRAD